MRTELAFVFALGLGASLSACQSEPDHQHAVTGRVGYDVPLGWKRADRGAATSVWTPDDNSHKESVTVIRGDIDPALAKAGGASIKRLLVQAQGSLSDAHVSAPEPLTTSQGLHGFRVAVDFMPVRGKPRQTRVHTILVDGTTLVHVLYTAASPVAGTDAMKMVVDTAHKES